jgi:hypothetical protein
MVFETFTSSNHCGKKMLRNKAQPNFAEFRESKIFRRHCKKSVLKIQEYIHEGANLTFYIPQFFNFMLRIPEYSLIYRFWF